MNLDVIASMTGVTKGTVSKILNKRATISPDLQKKIEDLLEQAGYVSRIQRKPIVVISRYSNSIFSTSLSQEMIRGVVDAATPQDIMVDIRYIHIPSNSEPDPGILEFVLVQRPVGIILDVNYPWPTSIIERIEKSGISCVQIGVENHLESMLSVAVDSFSGSYSGVKKLIQLGHRKIATIRWLFSQKNPEPTPKNSVLKHAGYLAALSEAGIEHRKDYEYTVYHEENKYSAHATRTALDTFMKLPDPPTAVFLENSYCSFPALMPSGGDNGALPPAIAGLTQLHFEDLPIQSFLEKLDLDLKTQTPPAWLLTPDYYAIGRAGLQLLVSKLNSPRKAPPNSLKVMPSLNHWSSPPNTAKAD